MHALSAKSRRDHQIKWRTCLKRRVAQSSLHKRKARAKYAICINRVGLAWLSVNSDARIICVRAPLTRGIKANKMAAVEVRVEAGLDRQSYKSTMKADDIIEEMRRVAPKYRP